MCWAVYQALTSQGGRFVGPFPVSVRLNLPRCLRVNPTQPPPARIFEGGPLHGPEAFGGSA